MVTTTKKPLFVLKYFFTRHVSILLVILAHAPFSLHCPRDDSHCLLRRCFLGNHISVGHNWISCWKIFTDLQMRTEGIRQAFKYVEAFLQILYWVTCFFADKIGVSNVSLKRTFSSLIVLHTFRIYGYLNFYFHSCDTEHFYFAEKRLWFFNFFTSHLPLINVAAALVVSKQWPLQWSFKHSTKERKTHLKSRDVKFSNVGALVASYAKYFLRWEVKWINTSTIELFSAYTCQKTHHLHTDMSLSVVLLYPSCQISILQTRCRSLFSLLTFVLLSGVQMDSHFPTILLEKPFYGKCLPYLITAHCSPCGYPVRFLLYPPVILPTSGCKKKEMNM